MRHRRTLAAALALIAPGMVNAASHTYPVASFERLRVDGPVEVRVEADASPRARIDADEALIDRVTVTQQGETLVVRVGGGGWRERGEVPRGGGPAVVTLATPVLRSAAVNAGARVSISRMTGQRVDVSVNGAGTVDLAAADADQLQATVIGTGRLTLAGRAGYARLLTNGSGTIDASALVTDDVTVRLDGTGETKANARFAARVTNTGLGQVRVTGNAKCTVVAPAGGQVICGVGSGT